MLRLPPRLFATLILGTATLFLAVSIDAQSQQAPPRHLIADLKKTAGPVDRFFDLPAGSDYPDTLIRDHSEARLKTAVDELGFRYIRFQAIFHDVLGTVSAENGKIAYSWSGIDQLYEGLLARHIMPFVELGFTPKVLATSRNSVFYWQGNTGTVEFTIPMNSNDIVLVKLLRNR